MLSGSKDKSLFLGQVEEQYGEEMAASWETGEEGGEEVYTVEDEVDEQAPLSEEAVNYCELVEPPEQTKFWNLPEELGEAEREVSQVEEEELAGSVALWLITSNSAPKGSRQLTTGSTRC